MFFRRCQTSVEHNQGLSLDLKDVLFGLVEMSDNACHFLGRIAIRV